MPARGQIEAMQAKIAKDAKHIIEELWGMEPTDTLWEIFKRETKKSVDDILTLQKDNILKLSFKNDNSSVKHLGSLDAGLMRMLMHCKTDLHVNYE